MLIITTLRPRDSVDIFLTDEGELEQVCIGSGPTDKEALTEAISAMSEALETLKMTLEDFELSGREAEA